MSIRKLAAIYNVWDGIEHLKCSMNCLKNDVDLFVIVYQDVSNYGEIYNPLPDMDLDGFNYILVKYTPYKIAGQYNETLKRNLGLEAAKNSNCSHFLNIDTDEYYKDFSSHKNDYIDSGKKGSVCKIYTYFKYPTLRFETEDGYFVPFIHELLPDTICGSHEYPYYVDATRRINCNDVILLDVHMHHFSWVRKDIQQKCRNSSAKTNIERGTMLDDYHNPKVQEGYYVKDYDKKLIRVENYFSIEETKITP